jgi:hypothetical protein
MSVAIFCDTGPCSPCVNRRFEGKLHLLHTGYLFDLFPALKMEVMNSSETPLYMHTSRPYIPEYGKNAISLTSRMAYSQGSTSGQYICRLVSLLSNVLRLKALANWGQLSLAFHSRLKKETTLSGMGCHHQLFLQKKTWNYRIYQNMLLSLTHFITRQKVFIILYKI